MIIGSNLPRTDGPTISEWSINRDGCVKGIISDSPYYTENSKITTSPIPCGEPSGDRIVTTIIEVLSKG